MNSSITPAVWLLILGAIWTLPWKTVALWRSARRGQKIWFFVFIILNTLGLLEILYIFIFSKKPKNEIK